MIPKGATVFVIDDDEAVRDSLHGVFLSVGVEARVFGSGDEFLSAYEPGAVGCIVVDIRMPGMDGFELLAEVARRAIGLPVVMITGHGGAVTEQRAMKAGAAAFLRKPFSDRVLLAAVETAIAGGSGS